MISNLVAKIKVNVKIVPTKPGKLSVMYLCVGGEGGIDFASFYDFDI